MKKIFTLLLIGMISMAYTEKNEKVYSKSLNKDVDVTLTLPSSYEKGKDYPVIYTLNGWSGNNRNFPDKMNIGELSDKYDIIYVSPDGGYDTWYISNENFISNELIKYIDGKYKTDKKCEKRAITGLSMGGFGAFYLGIKHKDIFGNIGSMSGGVNPQEYKYNWGIMKTINSNWEDYNIKDIAHSLLGSKTNIIFDCGISDFFIEPNRELHKKLLSLNIEHTYMERPGNHSWIYWRDSIKYQTLFFNENFRK